MALGVIGDSFFLSDGHSVSLTWTHRHNGRASGIASVVLIFRWEMYQNAPGGLGKHIATFEGLCSRKQIDT